MELLLCVRNAPRSKIAIPLGGCPSSHCRGGGDVSALTRRVARANDREMLTGKGLAYMADMDEGRFDRAFR